MNRIENWPTALVDFIEARRDVPFSWGESDCCLFTADAVAAVTGKDFAAAWRGTYADARGALAHIDAAGGIPAMVSFDEIPPYLAGRGDVVLLDMNGRDALGVCLGHVIAGQGPDGITFLPLTAAVRAWRTA